MLWLDVTGVVGLVPPGVGRQEGDSIVFEWKDDDGTLRNTFTWHPADGTWTSNIEQTKPDGTWETFCVDTYRRTEP